MILLTLPAQSRFESMAVKTNQMLVFLLNLDINRATTIENTNKKINIIVIIIIIIINHEKLWQNTAKECSIHICVEWCIELDD